MKLLYKLNDFLKIIPRQFDFNKKKILLFVTIPIKECEVLACLLNSQGADIDIIIKNGRKLDCEINKVFYYSSDKITQKSLTKNEISNLVNQKYDFIVIPLNSNSINNYKNIFTLSKIIKSKNIIAYNKNQDFFEMDKFIYLKYYLRDFISWIYENRN